MNKTLSKIIRYASTAMAIIAGYSMAVLLIIYKFNITAMPVWDNLIIFNDLLMLIVGVLGVRMYDKVDAVRWFVKLSLAQALASVLCVAAVYVPNKIWSVDVFDIIYVLSAALSVAVLVCCIMAGMRRGAERDGEA